MSSVLFLAGLLQKMGLGFAGDQAACHIHRSEKRDHTEMHLQHMEILLYVWQL